MLYPYTVLVSRYDELEAIIASLRVEAKALRYSNAMCVSCRKLGVVQIEDENENEILALSDPPFGEYMIPPGKAE